ncbi:hypothetical protein FRB94_007790 [Tulasnella sp. JGI-2019a]|nr:hypothetical protein FRB93_006803 [Tulasnella sp. JGI-2019a]KAG8997260.1 hypothetical protein FRB94_007790 [Tulasnella sp. JGI-2019a]
MPSQLPRGVHPMLELPELLLHTFNEFSVKDLMTVALTCKLWSDVATTIIWSSRTVPVSVLLSILAPVVHTKRYLKAKEAERSADTRQQANRVVDSLARGLSILVPITRQHWTRFLIYSQKIRSLLVDVVLDANSVDSLRRLLKTFQGTLCSGLRAMEIRARGCDGWRVMVDLFLAPSITDFTLDQGRGLGEGWMLLEFLTFQSPGLRSLTIRDRDPKTSAALEIVASAFKNLKRLHLGDITQGGWRNLEKAENLVDLSIVSSVIHGLWQKAIAESTSSTNTVTLTTLERLVIVRSYDTGAFMDALNNTAFPALRVLVFDTSDGSYDPGAFLRHLRTCSGLLEEVDITPPDMHIRSVLTNLSQLHTIRRLRISPPYGITDDDLATLAKNLPLLEQLRLREHTNTLPQLSEESLQVAVTYCEKLRDLRLSLRFQNLPSDPLASPPRVTSHRLEHLSLEIWNLPKAHDPLFACYIALFAPDVRELTITKTHRSPEGRMVIEPATAMIRAVADFRKHRQ